MKTKKFIAALMAASLLAGCSSAAGSGSASAADTRTVNLWATGSDNVRQIFETLTENFNNSEENNGKYEVKLNFLMSGTGTQSLTDMLVASKKADQKNTDYDLVDLGGSDLSTLIAQIGEDSLTKLDTSKIPNAKGVSAKSSEAAEYVQPYRGTTVILAYDSEKVANPPKTMDELTQWIKDNPGRFAYNTPGTGGAGASFVSTSIYNYLPDEAFTSNDKKWEEQWDEGFQYLAEIHPYMYQSGGSVVYPNKNQGALDLLNQGEIDMTPMWADMTLSQRASGQLRDSIKITQIDPSFTGSLQSLAIPANGSNPDGAYAFINYMLSDEAQETLVKQMAAIPLIDTSNMDMTGYEDLQNLDVSSFRIASIGDLSTDLNKRWETEIGTLN
jgi:putative spermidine/putrescine transport system substrate-binding protein